MFCNRLNHLKMFLMFTGMQIQSPGTEIEQHHGEATRENELRRICLCVEIAFELLSKRGNSG